MRVVHAAALTAAAMLLASIGSAQGIGSTAAREREKRKSAPAKPTKVYTDGDLGASVAATAPSSGQPADAAAGTSTPAGGTAQAEGATRDPAKTDAAQAEAEQRTKAQEAWRKNLEQARKEEQSHQELIDKVQAALNDPSGSYYGPGRANQVTVLEENKQKLTAVQTRITALEEEGRRNAYR